MLDVHPPHHAPNTWRDFFLHIATIVVGLLIAVGLEQAVEALHHRHLAHQTRENLRREIEQNRAAVMQDKANVQSDLDRMQANLVLARKAAVDPKALDQQSMHFTFEWSSFNQSAWRSARDSGALTLMPVEEVQRFDDAYNQQTFVDGQATAVFTEQTIAAAPLFATDGMPEPPTQTQRDAVLHDIAVVTLKLKVLQQLIANLQPLYAATLRE